MNGDTLSNKVAAASLFTRAMQAKNESTFDLLIGAAHKLDQTVPVEAARTAWRDQWVKKTHQERGLQS